MLRLCSCDALFSVQTRQQNIVECVAGVVGSDCDDDVDGGWGGNGDDRGDNGNDDDNDDDVWCCLVHRVCSTPTNQCLHSIDVHVCGLVV